MPSAVSLAQVRVAAPCSARWAAMAGDERVRFCGLCRKHVYNLSALSREEAEALVAEKEGDLCVRFFQRADGTVLTADCPVGLQQRMRRLAGRMVATVGMLLLLIGEGFGMFGRESSALAARRIAPLADVVDWLAPPLVGPVVKPPWPPLNAAQMRQLESLGYVGGVYAGHTDDLAAESDE